MRLGWIGLLAAVAACGVTAVAAEPKWEEILGPPQGTVPGARAALAEAVKVVTFRNATAPTRVHWETDLSKGLETAKAEGRPVFVTMRCLPCKSCSDFDKDVLEGGEELDPLLLQFVTVRLTSARDVDFRLMPMEQFQDMDTSWWGWFLSPEGRVYGVFGGRDASGDAGRTSVKALATTLRRVLAHHYDPRRQAWDVDGPLPVLEGGPNTPTTLAGFEKWLGVGHKREEITKAGCIHCHQVQEIMQQTAMEAGKFDKRRDLDIWPLPENTGIVLERDDGLLVKSVKDQSAAARAGIRTGDRLGGAAGRRLFSQADFRAALQRTPMTGAARLDLVWLRDGALQRGTLELADGWRKGSNGWRISFSEGVFGAFPGFWANDGGRFREQRKISADSMAVLPFFPKEQQADINAAWRGGLRTNDVIVSVNGESPNLTGRPWIVWFRTRVEPGDEVVLGVVDAKGERREVRYRPGKA
jgi:hypothetical protein